MDSVNVTEEYSDEAKLAAIKQMMFDIKALVETELNVETVLYYMDPVCVEFIMTSLAYYYLVERVTSIEEYRTWFGLGRKQTRTVVKEGPKVFGFAFGERTAVRFEIFRSETKESITEIAKSFATKYGFKDLQIQRSY